MTIVSCAHCGAKNRVNEQRLQTQNAVCGQCGQPLQVSSAGASQAAGSPQAITDANFQQQVLEASASAPVLVDFWADWCGPCHMIAPTIAALAADANNRYRVGKLNVDENRQTASRYNISSIPSLLIFKNGQIVDRLVGVQSKAAVAAKLMSHAEKVGASAQ